MKHQPWKREMKLISKESTKHKKCACCREKLVQSRKQQNRGCKHVKHGLKMLANYGYEEGMKRILPKQIQQTLEREKQPNLAPTVAQSSSQ